MGKGGRDQQDLVFTVRNIQFTLPFMFQNYYNYDAFHQEGQEGGGEEDQRGEGDGEDWNRWLIGLGGQWGYCNSVKKSVEY